MLIRLKSKREKGKAGGDQRLRGGLTPSQPHKIKTCKSHRLQLKNQKTKKHLGKE